METKFALKVYSYSASYNIFFTFQTPVRVIESNPNWSTVGLRDYKNNWPWGPRLQQGPNPESTVPPPLMAAKLK